MSPADYRFVLTVGPSASCSASVVGSDKPHVHPDTLQHSGYRRHTRFFLTEDVYISLIINYLLVCGQPGQVYRYKSSAAIIRDATYGVGNFISEEECY